MSLIKEIEQFFVSKKWLREVIEITYAYEKRWEFWYNTTVFDDFCEWRDDVEWYLAEIITQIEVYIWKLTDAEWIEKIVKNYCLYAADMVRMLLLWLPFEYEKAWKDFGLSKEQSKKKIKKISTIEQKWFGKKVTNDTFEASRVLYYLELSFRLYGKERLTWIERTIYKDHLTWLKEHSAYDKYLAREDDNEWIMSDDKYFAQEIPRSVYAQIFAHVFTFYGIDKWVFIDSRSSMYDGLDGLHIPDHDAYATMSLQRVLELIQHEIEVHYLVQENTSTLLPISDGANSLFREEWLAKFMEELINGATLASIDIADSIHQMLPCELMEWEKVQEFLQLYRKLRWKPTNWQWYFLRRKRNYSLTYPWTQHKDVTYSRGRFQVRSWLMNWGDFKKLYYAKVDFDDMEILDRSLSEKQKKALLYPQFFAERVLHKLLGINHWFEKYIQEKYPFIDFADYPLQQLSDLQSNEIEACLWLIKNTLPIPTYPWPSL